MEITKKKDKRHPFWSLSRQRDMMLKKWGDTVLNGKYGHRNVRGTSINRKPSIAFNAMMFLLREIYEIGNGRRMIKNKFFYFLYDFGVVVCNDLLSLLWQRKRLILKYFKERQVSFHSFYSPSSILLFTLLRPTGSVSLTTMGDKSESAITKILAIFYTYIYKYVSGCYRH